MKQIRVRTENGFSIFGKTKDYVDYLMNNQKQVIITDYFYTYAFLELEKYVGDRPIIYGVELPVRLSKEKIINNVCIYAKNKTGLEELFELNSKALITKYYQNYLQLSDLNEAKNISIGCSNLNHFHLMANEDKFLFCSPGTMKKDIVFALENNIKILPASNNKMLVDDECGRFCLGILGSRKAVGPFNQDSDYTPFWNSGLLTEEEWNESISYLGLTDTQKNKMLNDLNSFGENFDNFKVPKTRPIDYFRPETSLQEIVYKNFEEMHLIDIPGKEPYKDRLDREYKLIEEKGYINYFLIVWDVLNYCKQNGIFYGFGRGSCVGGLICYVLGITALDPIENDLLFERFLVENQTALPDIDLDFQDDRRDEVYDYLLGIYGEEHVAHLSSLDKYRNGIWTDIGRALQLEPEELKVRKSDFEKEIGTGEETIDFLAEKYLKEKLADIPYLKYVYNIYKHVKTEKAHPCGIALCKDKLYTFASKDKEKEQIQIDAFLQADFVDLLKLDLLGLKNLTIMDLCLKKINKDRAWLLQQPKDDPLVFDLLNREDNFGVFQFEQNTVKKVASLVRPITSLSDMCDIIALARPGPLSIDMHEKYAKNSNQPMGIPEVDVILEPTRHVVVYQEQFMRIIKEYCNMGWVETSKLRKVLSKYLGGSRAIEGLADEINKIKMNFFERAKANNKKEEEIELVWNNCVITSGYSFNKSHSLAYAYVSYCNAWLKTHYPIEFALAFLNEKKETLRVIEAIYELRKSGFEVKIFEDYTAEDKKIYFKEPIDTIFHFDWIYRDGKIIGGFNNFLRVSEKQSASLRKQLTTNTLTEAKYKTFATKDSPFTFIEKIQKIKEKYSGDEIHKTTDEFEGYKLFIGKFFDLEMRKTKKGSAYQIGDFYDDFGKKTIFNFSGNGYFKYTLEEEKLYAIRVDDKNGYCSLIEMEKLN
jgi:DNA polymerase III alpha subunit